ncbi:DUF654-domain-containing protein [Ramicandelaber brevisporus]|nr:DUF654-domain-containing protein [Ramicandelaber brevisporus]
MSSRAIRRAMREKEEAEQRRLAELAAAEAARVDHSDDEEVNDNDNDNDDEEAAPDSDDDDAGGSTAVNAFDLLMGGGGGDDNDEDEDEDEEEPEPEPEPVTETPVTSSSKSKSKKKNKKTKKGGKGGRGKAAANGDDTDDEEEGSRIGNVGVTLDELDAIISEVKRKEQASAAAAAAGGGSQSKEEGLEKLASAVLTKLRNLLSTDPRLFDAEAEMRRVFGTGVAKANERRKAAGHNATAVGRQAQGIRTGGDSVYRRTAMAQRLVTWPPVQSTGLIMENVRNDKVSGQTVHRFVHSANYQVVQREFLTAVLSHDMQHIQNISYNQPYHIDSLLQLSEMYRHQGDIATAGEYVEKALYGFEMSFTGGFNITSSAHSRLEYRFVENRPLFIAISRHIGYLGRRGCWRTALEFNKVLMRLDAGHGNDPMAALLSLDFFALKAGEHEWFLKFLKESRESEKELDDIAIKAYHRENDKRNQQPGVTGDLDPVDVELVQQISGSSLVPEWPNMVYSEAYAQWMMERDQEAATERARAKNPDAKLPKHVAAKLNPLAKIGREGGDGYVAESVELLASAILKYPLVLKHLNDKNTLNLESKLSRYSYLADASFDAASGTDTVGLLCHLYAERAHSLYAAPEAIEWLRSGLDRAIMRLGHKLSSNAVDECIQRRDELVAQLNCELDNNGNSISYDLARHILILDVRELVQYLPEFYTKRSMFAFDPLPPPDDVNQYDASFGGVFSGNPAVQRGIGANVIGAGGAQALEQMVDRLRGMFANWMRQNPEDGNNNDDGDDAEEEEEEEQYHA